eukprot:TRINITY_DN22244_c0_g1_i1.p1 TRINITY_DN22244_c0_g1~~TRINITY_DN22244_c0_g1_i1.p1  ORF type:complete len:484 (+),score=59.19 TRINITY_DN22244_c0_g1_i1:58-1509(+)
MMPSRWTISGTRLPQTANAETFWGSYCPFLRSSCRKPTLRTASAAGVRHLPLAAMARPRNYSNTLPDHSTTLQELSTENDAFRMANELASSEEFLRSAEELKKQIVDAAWGNRSTRLVDPSVYSGLLGVAFLCWKSFDVTGNAQDLEICLDITKSCVAATEGMRKPVVTFYCGQAGAAALGAVAANAGGHKEALQQYLRLFMEVADAVQAANAEEASSGEERLPDELLYGRAGFLWAALFINAHVTEGTIPATILDPVVKMVLKKGREEGSQSGCPLLYYWHNTPYLGAAHGLAGILHVLLHFPLAFKDLGCVRLAMLWLIHQRFPSGNYPSSKGSSRDQLLHWCHGAPGVALALCTAAKSFPNESTFVDAAVEAGDVVWERGLLSHSGLCHGISGNAYTFLALYRTTGQPRHLHRAMAFATFLRANARRLVATGEMHGGDRPLSLMEGATGMACLFFDITQPDAAAFPGFEIGRSKTRGPIA